MRERRAILSLTSVDNADARISVRNMSADSKACLQLVKHVCSLVKKSPELKFVCATFQDTSQYMQWSINALDWNALVYEALCRLE